MAGQDGQSLIIVVLAMFAVLAISAFAIDLAQWYQKHHHAQVAADAAVLAAANYMGHGGTAGTATSTATSFASANSMPLSSSNVTVDTTNKTVTVTLPTSASLTLAGVSLGSGPTISVRAVATWARSDCGGGTRCGFIFGADPVCSGDTNVTGTIGNQTRTVAHGVTIQKNGQGNSSAGISGGIISNSNITTSMTGQQSVAASATWSNVSGSGCSGPSPSSPSPYSAAYQAPPFVGWPLDYTQVYPACPGTSTLFSSVSCMGAGGFPSYCTADVTSTSTTAILITAPVAGDVYCDAGSGNPADPSTWNGTLNVAPPSQGTYNASYIAGTVNFNIATGSTFGPAATGGLLAYAAECNNSTPLPTTCPSTAATTTAPAVTITSNGNANITGDIFAPAGTIDSALGGNPSITTFLEGWDVVYNADGTVSGGGPTLDGANNFLYDFLIG